MIERIITNKAQCQLCKDIIQSRSVHDFVSCKCGEIHVDGGREYLKRGYKTKAPIEMSKIKYTYDYPMPSCTATAAIFCCDHVLLIKRKEEPFKDCWALPGGFMNLNEDLLTACVREVKEETSLEVPPQRFKYHGMRDEVDRDPRGRVLDHLYSVAISFAESLKTKSADDASEFMWQHIKEGKYSEFPPLAFDHERSLRLAIDQRGSTK